MHVVRISEYVTPSPGGREVHVRELSRRQTRTGDAVRLLYRVGGERDWSFEGMQLLGRSGAWRRLPHPLVSTVFLCATLAVVARRRRSVDLVHLHGDYLEALAAGCLRVLGLPSLLTLHGRLSPRVLHTIGFVYRLPSHIVAVSPAIASQLEEVGVPSRRVTIQHSGVDREIFYPPERSPATPPFRVIVGSALIPLKDHTTLLKAVLLLQDEGLDVRLDIAGVGPERARLERIAPPNTHFHGQLERPLLGDLMRSCHAAAVTSVDTPEAGEGTPTFLMEAIACGLPFVATETGGVPRLASRSEAGFVVPQGNAEMFGAALRSLAVDGPLYGTCRRAALEFAPRLDWDVVAERLGSLMGAVVDASPTSGVSSPDESTSSRR